MLETAPGTPCPYLSIPVLHIYHTVQILQAELLRELCNFVSLVKLVPVDGLGWRHLLSGRQEGKPQKKSRKCSGKTSIVW